MVRAKPYYPFREVYDINHDRTVIVEESWRPLNLDQIAICLGRALNAALLASPLCQLEASLDYMQYAPNGAIIDVRLTDEGADELFVHNGDSAVHLVNRLVETIHARKFTRLAPMVMPKGCEAAQYVEGRVALRVVGAVVLNPVPRYEVVISLCGVV